MQQIIKQYKWRIDSYQNFLRQYQSLRQVATDGNVREVLTQKIRRCHHLILLANQAIKDIEAIAGQA